MYAVLAISSAVAVFAVFTKAVPPKACFANFRWEDCGKPPVPVMYYWKPGSRCEVGIWRGCLPNDNMFKDEYDCVSTCIFRVKAAPEDYHKTNDIEELHDSFTEESLTDETQDYDSETTDGTTTDSTDTDTTDISNTGDDQGATDSTGDSSVTSTNDGDNNKPTDDGSGNSNPDGNDNNTSDAPTATGMGDAATTTESPGA